MKTITVYTTSTCAYCAMVKKFLDMKKAIYEVVNLDEQPEKREEVHKLSGALTVPVTIVREAYTLPQIVIGWQPAKLAEVIA